MGCQLHVNFGCAVVVAAPTSIKLVGTAFAAAPTARALRQAVRKLHRLHALRQAVRKQRLLSTMGVFWGQLKALSWKNLLLLRRTRYLTFCELLAPLVVMCVLGSIDVALKFQPPTATQEPFLTLSSTPPAPLECRVFDNEDGRFGYRRPIPGAWCVPLLFVPTTSPEVMALMKTVATRNGFSAPTLFKSGTNADVTAKQSYPAACGLASNPAGAGCMLGFETTQEMKDWCKNNPGRAGAAVLFGDSKESVDIEGNTYIEEVITTALPTKHLKYEIWFNTTALRYQMYASSFITPRPRFPTYPSPNPLPGAPVPVC